MIKLFAHRGYIANDIKENSLEAILAAQKLKFLGVEFDIWYIDGKFLLKHDEPLKEEVKLLPQIGDLIKMLNPSMEMWIDFKNLTPFNAYDIAVELSSILKELKRDINNIYFAPFVTDMEIALKIHDGIKKALGDNANYVSVCDEEVELGRCIRFIKKNQCRFLSINHKIITKDVMKELGDSVSVFAYTVNDLDVICNLSDLGVAAVATDFITPKDQKDYQKRSS